MMESNIKYLLLSLMAFLLIGCTTINSDLTVPKMVTAQDFSERNLTHPDLQQFLQQLNVSMTNVWDFQHLYWAAVYYNPDLAEVKAQLMAVKAAEITAGQSPNPNVTISPTYDNSTSPAAWLLGLGLNVPIETNGKRGLRVAAAELQSLSAYSLMVSKVWDVRNKVLNAVIDIQIAQETIAKIEALAKTQGQISEIYTKRTEQGQLPTALASQNQLLYQQSLLQIQQAKTSLVQAQAMLAGAIGVPTTAIQHVKISNTYPAFKRTNASRQTVLSGNPMILSALYDYRVAHENLQLELAKQVPDIALGPGYEWNSQQGGKYTLGLSFNLPILNNNEGPIAEAVAKREFAAKHFDTVQITTINAIEQAEFAYQSTNREMNEANRIVGIQQDKEKRLHSMIQENNVGSLPVLYAESETKNAQVATLLTKAKLLRAESNLENTMRQPLFGAVISPNSLMRK